MSEVIWKPHVTVAAVIERDGRFLLVEELIEERLVLNQPAGHLDENESLVVAVARETLEETAWEFKPESLIGLYLWKEPAGGQTFLRAAFAGCCLQHHPERPLDTGVQRALWMDRAEIASTQERLRSPLVLMCIDDYLSGKRFPLDLIRYLNGSTENTGL